MLIGDCNTMSCLILQARENLEETKSLIQTYLSLLHLQDARESTSPEKRQMLAALNRAYRAPPRPITQAGYTLQSYQAKIISKIPPSGAAATIDTLPATVTAEYLQEHYIAELRCGLCPTCALWLWLCAVALCCVLTSTINRRAQAVQDLEGRHRQLAGDAEVDQERPTDTLRWGHRQRILDLDLMLTVFLGG